MTSNDPAGSHAERCFFEACARVVDAIIEDEPVMLQNLSFCVEMIGSLVPVSLFQVDNLLRMQDRVFGNAHLRDFILRLTNQFVLRLTDHPEGRKVYEDLLHRLAFAVDASTHSVGMTSMGQSTLAGRTTPAVVPDTLIPDEVAKSLPTQESILSALLGNKWLVTILMIHFYMPKPELPDNPQGKPRK